LEAATPEAVFTQKAAKHWMRMTWPEGNYTTVTLISMQIGFTILAAG